MAAGAILGGFKMFTGIMGARSQSRLDRQSVNLQYEDNLEKIRRRKFTQDQTAGEGVALTQASGVRHSPGSTAQGYLDTMTGEFDKEIKWMQKYAITAKRMGLQQAKNNFSTNATDAFFSGLSSFGS